jgi:hypothetical protein
MMTEQPTNQPTLITQTDVGYFPGTAMGYQIILNKTYTNNLPHTPYFQSGAKDLPFHNIFKFKKLQQAKW